MPGLHALHAVASSLEVLQTSRASRLLLTSMLPDPRLQTSSAAHGALASLMKVAARENMERSFASIAYDKLSGKIVDGIESDVFGIVVAGKS
jgi:hypothetical protein